MQVQLRFLYFRQKMSLSLFRVKMIIGGASGDGASKGIGLGAGAEDRGVIYGSGNYAGGNGANGLVYVE